MNKIEVKKRLMSTGYEEKVIYIDDRPLYDYINKWTEGNTQVSKIIYPADGLANCWINYYDFESDARFIKFILEKGEGIIPILTCPEDLDFSCLVIVVDIVREGDRVIWKRIGEVNHSGESLEEEKSKGILCTESYSEEDWIRYGDNIALEKVDSPKWQEWVGSNWEEEQYRRRINYTYPYYQNENNILWFGICNFEFDSKEYDAVIDSFYCLI